MYNRYRLMSTVYDREEENQRILPEKRIFLSVEGNTTEKEYFDGISKNRVKIGINAKVDVEVLRRGSKDTNSAPQQAKAFPGDEIELVNNIGCNLWKMIEELREYGE